MPIQTTPGSDDRSRFTHLEAVGRLLAGMSPWLAVDLPMGEERSLQQRLLQLALSGLEVVSDPDSPDYVNWSEGGQPLVDAAFLAQAMLRAPAALWDPLHDRARRQLAVALELAGRIVPRANNWLLFRAMVEAWRFRFTGEGQWAAIAMPLEIHGHWYLGDGAYGDGPEFRWDYYNSYVIHPMILDILSAVEGFDHLRSHAWARAQRYAEVQERFIAADGTFPVLGRSITYRGGAFHLLAMLACCSRLPDSLEPAAVREALTAVIRRTLEAPGTFDELGWLNLGLAGRQPELAEAYISTGSLYLCSTIFLPLGLPPSDPFWTDPPMPWTAVRAWRGENIKRDSAYHEA